MNFKTYLQKQILPSFSITVTCITFGMAVLGTIFQPQARFSYGVLFSPFLFGLVAAALQLVGYSRKELTLRGALARKVVYVVLLEAAVLGILYGSGGLTSPELTLSLAVMILVIYFAVTLVMWLNDSRTSRDVNAALKELQRGGKGE